MAKISNETKLLLKLAHERMKAEKLNWVQLASNPNSNSNNEYWLAGYEYAWKQWDEALAKIATELEGR